MNNEEYQPHSKEMERNLLGSAIFNGQMPLIVGKGCKPDWFHGEKNKRIWEVCRKIYDSQGELDEIMLLAELESSKIYEAEFGNSASFIFSFSDVGTMTSHYIKIVQEKYNHRQIIRQLRMAIEKASRPSSVFDEVKDGLSPMLNSLYSISTTDDGITDKERITDFEERKLKEMSGEVDQVPEENRCYIGMPKLEEIFGHIDNRDRDNYIVIGAPSSRGKSALARQMINENLTRHADWVCAGFLLESSKEDFWHSCCCSKAKINTRRPANTWKDSEKTEYLNHLRFLKEQTEKRLFLFDNNSNIEEIKARCNEVKAKTGRLDLLLVDYVQIVERERRSSPESEVAGISRELKSIQKSLRCITVSGTQLNEDGKVRESRAIFNDATRVWIMDRPDSTPEGAIQTDESICQHYFQTVHQQKFRNGRLAKAGIRFQVTTQEMSDW